jgi:putative transposase
LRYSKWKELSEEQKNNYEKEIFVKENLLIETYAYSLMPNHHHFLMKQLKEEGIRKFIANFQNSFTKFFNQKNNRQGTLFTRSFKIKRIDSEEEVKHVSRYIHLNQLTGFLLSLEQLRSTRISSFIYYANSIKPPLFLNTEFLLKIFNTRKKYIKFITDQIDYQRKLAKIKHLILEK